MSGTVSYTHLDVYKRQESEDMVKSAQALYKNSRKDDTDATYKLSLIHI